MAEFVEKPDAALAAQMVEEGCWTWNSGMFVFPPRLFLDELRRLQPDIALNAAGAVNNAQPDLEFVRLDRALFEQCPSISVDNAVMEHTDRAVVVRGTSAGTTWAAGRHYGG